MIQISIPGTSFKRTMKLKTHLRSPSDLAEELSLVDWNRVCDFDPEKVNEEWGKSYLELLKCMEQHDHNSQF